MESVIVGVVSKDKLDVAVLPSGEAFTVERKVIGLEDLAKRLGAIAPHLIALEPPAASKRLSQRRSPRTVFRS